MVLEKGFDEVAGSRRWTGRVQVDGWRKGSRSR